MGYSNTDVERASFIQLEGRNMHAEGNLPQDDTTLHKLDMNVNSQGSTLKCEPATERPLLPYGSADSIGSTSNHHAGQQTVRCANCEIDILWAPIIVQGKAFCCTGCAAGGPCNCDYSEYRSVNISGVIHYGYGPQPE